MSAALLRLFFLTLPFQFALQPTENIDLHLSRVFATAIFAVWAVEGLWSRRLVIPTGAATFLFLSFTLVACFSSLWAADPVTALRKAAFLLPYAALFVVISSLIVDRGAEYVRSVSTSFVWGASLAAVVAISQVALSLTIGIDPVLSFWLTGLYPFFLGQSFASAVASFPSLLVDIGGVTFPRASGLFPDPHILAFYMGLAIPLSFALSAEGTMHGPRKWLFVAAGCLMILSDLLSFSRGGYLGIAAGVVVTFFLFRSPTRSSARRMVAMTGLVFVLTALLFIPNPVRDRFSASFSLEEGSNAGRLSLWKEGMGNLSDAWLTGYGLGNYATVVKPSASPREPIYAHDLYLDVALEVGVIGAVFLITALMYALLRLAWKTERIFRAAAVSLSIFLVHAIFDTPLFSVHVLPALLLILAFSNHESRKEPYAKHA